MSDDLVKRLQVLLDGAADPEHLRNDGYGQSAAIIEALPELLDRIEALEAEVAKLRAERDNLAGIVQGWHYLAVGPDEMGDYYTHKQLVKLSEPYASPGLRALNERNSNAG
jgi:hypothetical protein